MTGTGGGDIAPGTLDISFGIPRHYGWASLDPIEARFRVTNVDQTAGPYTAEWTTIGFVFSRDPHPRHVNRRSPT